MIHTETFITFAIYLSFLLCIGIYFYIKTNTHEDYSLGSRGVGYWVTALSAQASDMSGWLLMGLPAAVFLYGFREIWVVIGLIIGTFANWKFLAPKLRVQTEYTNTITIPTFLEKKLNDKSGYLRNISAIIILFFFTIYSASGLVAAGKLFETILGISYYYGVIIGGGSILIYILLGGYLACCWTDFFQGILMFLAIIIVPATAYFVGSNDISSLKSINFNFNYSILSILSGLSWGLGYFGQPHILVRFMSIKNVNEVWKSRLIAMIWVIISLIGAIAIGFTGTLIFSSLADPEKIFIFMISKLFNPWIAGILFAAILSAIMSTISSQLLVCSSTLTEDFYKFFKKNASDKELVLVGRISIIIVFLLAGIISMNPNSEVLSLVAYAWAGFGAVFGPAILISLYSKNANYKSVLLGMIAATITVVLWRFFGLNNYLYEMLPAFIINTLFSLIFNKK